MPKIAAVQYPPIFYSLEKGLERAVEIIAEAANEGVELLTFPEAWLTGYPMMTWSATPSNEFGTFSGMYKLIYDNAPDLSKDHLRPVCDAAREHGVVVVMGLNERASEMSAGTLYNTAVTIDATGDILNVHRKVMPTNAERMVWGFGDARGINVVDTAVGRVGCLLCWENFMPLARAAIYAQNVEIYCAPTADHRENWLASMQHIGREGSCFVVSVMPAVEGADVPDNLPAGMIEGSKDAWVAPGNGIICGPLGNIVAGPMKQEKGFLKADIDLGQVREARRSFDVVGHYSRPDIFQLTVNKSPQVPVQFQFE